MAEQTDGAGYPVRCVNGRPQRPIRRNNPPQRSGHASAISDAGHVIAWASNAQGQFRGVLLRWLDSVGAAAR